MPAFSSKKCHFCGKPVFRDRRRINESNKFGWKTYCSLRCLGLSRRRAEMYTCSRQGCGNTFARSPRDLKKSKDFYCSHKCSALVSNLSRTKRVRICPTCKKEFIKERKYCSVKCVPKRVTKYTEDVIIVSIKNFVLKHDRVPVKKEMWKYYKAARLFFGSWNNAIKASGFDPNPVMFASKHIAKDGHKCDSLSEKIIDDWLLKKHIKHERSYPYPTSNGFTVDFKIKNYWIEFFGLVGEHRRYDVLKNRKIKLAQKLGLNLIEIYPTDLFPKNMLSSKIGFLAI